MGTMVYDPQLQEASKGTFKGVNSATILAGSSKSFGNGGGSEPIPEPTSGLLLVVGGALLALRRRQK